MHSYIEKPHPNKQAGEFSTASSLRLSASEKPDDPTKTFGQGIRLHI